MEIELNFRVWEESSVEDAVVGVFSGGADLKGPERTHTLSRKTTDFSPQLRNQIKNLGAVKSVVGRAGMAKISRAIDDGVTISDLVRMISARSPVRP